MFQQTISAWADEPLKPSAPTGLVDAVAADRLLTVVRESGGWRLKTDSRVGIAIGPGWEIRVVPKLKIPRLIFLLSYATDPHGWQSLVAPMEREDDLYSAVAAGFAHHAYRALAQGALRGYVTVDEAASMFRGRMRVGAQLAHRPGLPTPVEISRDEHAIDIPENRLLAAASRVLLSAPRVADLARAQLRRVRATLAEVGTPTGPTAPEITRLNKRYEPALRLAELILRHWSIGTDRGPVSSVAFVFDMNRIFEDFLGAALSEAMRAHGGHVGLQLNVGHLDKQRELGLRPDITWWRDGRLAAVLDAKYKRLTSSSFPNADAYQMLAYCHTFGLSRGTLVYARDEVERDREHALRGGITIDVTTVNVEREPAEIFAQVNSLATRIAGA